jgi:hypothetical protein
MQQPEQHLMLQNLHKGVLRDDELYAAKLAEQRQRIQEK